jgi:hypothetical protein
MDTEFLSLLSFLSAIMSIMGLVYLIFGFFIGGLRGNTLFITGGWARVFGLCYILLGLPVFAFTYGTTYAPTADWYLQMQPYINEGNYLFAMIVWIVIVLVLHGLSYFAGQSD